MTNKKANSPSQITVGESRRNVNTIFFARPVRPDLWGALRESIKHDPLEGGFIELSKKYPVE